MREANVCMMSTKNSREKKKERGCREDVAKKQSGIGRKGKEDVIPASATPKLPATLTKLPICGTVLISTAESTTGRDWGEHVT